MFEAESLVVYAGRAAFGVADFSPACLKLKTYLRMAGVTYVAKLGDPRRGPTSKVPYITHGGKTIGDSGLIIDYLKQALGDPLDAKLTSDQRALGHLLRRTVEESLYWSLMCARWGDDVVIARLFEQFRTMLPPIVGGLIFKAIRRKTLRDAWGQGMWRHTTENISKHGCADIDAVAQVLGDKPYLFGDAPTSFDAAIYGSIANVLALPSEGKLATRAREHVNLVHFVQRVTQKYWDTPDTVDG